jgi:hypothetical protein
VPIESVPDLVSIEVTNAGRQETIVQMIGFLTEPTEPPHTVISASRLRS